MHQQRASRHVTKYGRGSLYRPGEQSGRDNGDDDDGNGNDDDDGNVVTAARGRERGLCRPRRHRIIDIAVAAYAF